MADVVLALSDESFIKDTFKFESELKTKLSWSRKLWSERGQQGSRFNKLCNSMNYWKVKLKAALEEKAIVITLFNIDKDTRVDVFRIIEEIEKLDKELVVKGVTNFRNPRYLAVYFENKEQAEFVRKNFRLLENSFVVYLEWALDLGPLVTSLKVHWLPMSLDTEVIKKALDRYVTCIEEERVALDFMSGRTVPSGKVIFKVMVKKDIKIENIPHVLNIAELEALITMPDRLPLCLNCNVLGHISKECKLRFCAVCNVLMEKTHICSVNKDRASYAAIVKVGELTVDPDDWGAAISPENPETSTENHDLLKNKINSLENRLQELEAEEDEHMQARLEKKRKAVADIKVPASEGANGNKMDVTLSAEGPSVPQKEPKSKVQQVRNYGRKTTHSVKLQKSEAKFNAICGNPEFVFSD